MIVDGFAKVNLSLRVRPRDDSGYHPLRSLVQSVGWSDRLTLLVAADDAFTIDGDLPAEEDNLAWRAVEAVRTEAATRSRWSLHLHKRIAVAAGLGGGSADAAAGLVAATRLLRTPAGTAERLAPALGSDVPFCLVGGTAWMEGRGEILTTVPLRPDYAVAIAVPPFELATAAVYRHWDEMEGPTGPVIGGRSLPPSLRGFDDVGNDLLPAALDVRPDLGDWMDDLAERWDRPLLLSGSGPACFAFFADEEEAESAVAAVQGARAVWAGVPVAVGVRVVGE
ncbi:MAG: 4-(cytidine 5'-diphospho)-2-C-methyl-D-erythritol kinase [Acidimicrobiia bacterium]|nr:4-(cytidine 5'-diphospho)-2-C-methyl-D-erythritol kinase [Acidimicrobiia bacterium]